MTALAVGILALLGLIVAIVGLGYGALWFATFVVNCLPDECEP